MWSYLLALAVANALDPVRLGLTLLVISRSRPVQNMLAYWCGSVSACIYTILIPLIALHGTQTSRALAHDWTTSPAARHIQLSMGVLALSIAGVMTVRSLITRRRRADLPTSGANTSTLVLDSQAPHPVLWLLARGRDAPTTGGSAIRRLLGRFHNAWENGSLWVGWVIGFGFAGVEPFTVVLVLATITASEGSIGMQLSAATAFIVGMLAVVEIALVSYLAKPAKTKAIVQVLHEWALAHRRKLLIAILAVGGISLVASGMRST
ncbi:GAP family protein [Mycobacterium sp.]|uniref:GAP family protein n=1 Tax=Mycobacterium sp. TaxID=1785 RepID=UPI003F7FC4A8